MIYQVVDKYGLIWLENHNKQLLEEELERGYSDSIEEEGLYIIRVKED